MTPDLTVVVVNYNSSGFVEALLPSIFEPPTRLPDGRRAEIEVVVVDNASRHDDPERLERLRSERVKLVRNTENVGYAIANEQGFRVGRGRWHCVSNPDIVVRPGCLAALLEALAADPGAAIAGPLASMDVEGSVLLPPNELPDPWLEAMTALSRHHDEIARFNARRRARFAHRYWRAERPFALPMLSGGFFVAPRELLLEHGLFDGNYPLYYEDTDLFRRYHERGFRLLHVPAARVVHHFSRSAIPRMKASLYRNRIGAERYFRRWFGPAGHRAFLAGDARAAAAGRDGECPWPLTMLAPSREPPVLELPAVAGAYFEVAGNPKFSLTVGIFPPEPGPHALPASFWHGLANTHYWCRAVDPASGDTLSAWRVTKCP